MENGQQAAASLYVVRYEAKRKWPLQTNVFLAHLSAFDLPVFFHPAAQHRSSNPLPSHYKGSLVRPIGVDQRCWGNKVGSIPNYHLKYESKGPHRKLLMVRTCWLGFERSVGPRGKGRRKLPLLQFESGENRLQAGAGRFLFFETHVYCTSRDVEVWRRIPIAA